MVWGWSGVWGGVVGWCGGVVFKCMSIVSYITVIVGTV